MKTNVCLLEQRKQSFLTLAKENQSPLGLILKYSDIFLYKSLFCSLSIAVPRSSLITGVCATYTSYVIYRNGFHLRQLGEVKEMGFKYGYFSYKNTSICNRRPLFTPLSCVRHVLIWMDVLYLNTFGLLNKNTGPCHYKAWKSKDSFIYITLWIGLDLSKRRTSYTPGMPWGWVKHGLIFIFGWTNPLKYTALHNIC